MEEEGRRVIIVEIFVLFKLVFIYYIAKRMWKTLAGVLLIVWLCRLWFYRLPPMVRFSPGLSSDSCVYSPAYGRIIQVRKTPFDYMLISIFLSLTDIHYQVIPHAGIIEDVQYDVTGRFELAYEEPKSRQNEKTILTIRTLYGPMVVYQIAGIAARRIDTYVQPGELVTPGQLLGLIHFGSRVDLWLPQSSRFQLYKRVNDRVYGMETLLGCYRN